METHRKRNRLRYFTRGELTLWLISAAAITVSFFCFPDGDYMTLAASLIGVTSLILAAKGNPMGQLLIVVFAVLYGIISWQVKYYGEVLTYLGMTAPMAIAAYISWVRHPYHGEAREVRIAQLTGRDVLVLIVLSAAVTTVFFFILKALGTARLAPSTLSVTTSFAAVWLTYKRSAYYALAYAANDAVLVLLWCLAARSDMSAVSVAICFTVFLANDIYGFINWKKMEKRQTEASVKRNAAAAKTAR